MNIKQVSYGVIGAMLMAASLSSCTDHKYENDAKAKAVKYLNGSELLKAEKFASEQYNSDEYSAEAMQYWDSLLIEAKAKQAYIEGQKLIKDSTDGIYHEKNKYELPLDTVVTSNAIGQTRKEYAKYVSAEEFIRARKNAPGDYNISLYNKSVGPTHYWNLITCAGKQNEAYQKGMADERRNQKNLPKIESFKSLK